nr:NYN domain-containing protein [Micromonospora sp. DSM 115978]
MAIDAMDLLHSGSVDGIALASSDSDFTRLAERIREAGLTVYGFGEEKMTNPGLVAACDVFVFVETLAAATLPTPAAEPDRTLVPAPAISPAQAALGTARVSETSADVPHTAVGAS